MQDCLSPECSAVRFRLGVLRASSSALQLSTRLSRCCMQGVLKWHAQSLSALSELGRSSSRAPFAQEEAKAEAEDDTAWDEETIASDEEGLVIFDGGTYSRGPAALVELGGAAGAGDGEDLEADKERLERQLTLEVCTQLFSA